MQINTNIEVAEMAKASVNAENAVRYACHVSKESLEELHQTIANSEIQKNAHQENLTLLQQQIKQAETELERKPLQVKYEAVKLAFEVSQADEVVAHKRVEVAKTTRLLLESVAAAKKSYTAVESSLCFKSQARLCSKVLCTC